jgi:hypothetical protein
LELKIFEKEIDAELVVMEQQTRTRQEGELKSRFTPSRDRLQNEIEILKNEISAKEDQRNSLVLAAQQEADGTGGSKRRNLGPIYKVKKANAERVETELTQLVKDNNARIKLLESDLATNDSSMYHELGSLEQSKINGMAARLDAMKRIGSQSSAIWWANVFVIILFIIVESAPVVVKLISPKGPYDNLLRIAEHGFTSNEVESIAKVTAETKERVSTLSQEERSFVSERLGTELR